MADAATGLVGPDGRTPIDGAAELTLPPGVVRGQFQEGKVTGSASERKIRALTNALVSLDMVAGQRITEALGVAEGMEKAIMQLQHMLGQRDAVIAHLLSERSGSTVTVLPTRLEFIKEQLASGELEVVHEVDETEGVHRLRSVHHDLGPREIESIGADGAPTTAPPALPSLAGDP